MHLRLWALGAASLLAVLAVPATAHASVGVGIQAGPVRLGGAAHPGGSYALPDVLVMNTGSQQESVSIRIERVSAGAGRTVPPSWVRADGRAVTLARNQSARIPLELVVPAGAKPGPYFSDVLAQAGAANSAGGAAFDVGAATRLAFTVAPGPVSRPWFSVPTWVLPGIGIVLLLAAAAILVRRSGLRIRVEREPAGSGSLAVRARHRLRSGQLLLAVTLIGLAGCGSTPVPQGSSGGASITLTLNTVSDMRVAVVNPPEGAFGDCHGGSATDHTHSTGKALGFPNGYCSFYPITIKNEGIPADIKVYGADASPSDGDGQWVLCNTGSHPAVACTGTHDRPGTDQYLLANYNEVGNKYAAGLTDNLACDHVFGSGGSCWAGHGAVQQEGVELVGPASTTDNSTVWTVTITWFAVPR